MNPTAPLDDVFDLSIMPTIWDGSLHEDFFDLEADFAFDDIQVPSIEDRVKSLLEALANKEFLEAITPKGPETIDLLLKDIRYAIKSGSSATREDILRAFIDPNDGPNKKYFKTQEVEKKVDALKKEIASILPQPPPPIKKEPIEIDQKPHKPPTAPSKIQVVLCAIKGEPVDSLSKKLGIEASVIKEWCIKALHAMQSALEAPTATTDSKASIIKSKRSKLS